MRIDVTSMFFNSKIEGQTATPAWGTSIGQSKSRDCRIDDFRKEVVEMVIGMTYKSVADLSKLDVSKGSDTREILTCSVFEDVYINKKKIENTQYVLLLVREHSKNHDGRLIISYAPYIKYNGIENQSCIDLMQKELGCTPEGCWFVYDISIKNQSELYFSAVVVNASAPMVYSNSVKSKNRSEEWKALIPADGVLQETLSESLQQIFYGAPGTGKSHKIKDDANVKIADAKNLVFRTTFHPDSDYSTFVGCYKPTKEPSLHKQPILDYDSLVDKLKEYLATEPVNITRSCALFGCDYHDSIVKMQESGGHTIPNLVADAYKSGTTYDSTVRAGMNIYESGTKTQGTSSSITYTFVPQAFLQAYVAAWNNPDENVYLVIEEINRGNCAQIFGDLFQLLDRDDNGESEYPIMADRDLAKYLLYEKDENNVDVLANKEGIKDGKLKLPKNLYIWATMNTSDQSLFPIDSAFKRRWDWKYIPIKDHEEKDFKIDINGTIYSWWGFLEKINKVIGKVTSSEDKKLGYFFVKANGKDIDATKFVGKVLFYLWNDVFKNYGFDNTIFSRAENKKFEFSDFFDKNGEPETTVVNEFLKKLDETIDKDNSFIIKKSNDTVSSEEESSDTEIEQQEG